jgi:hypothetical protein
VDTFPLTGAWGGFEGSWGGLSVSTDRRLDSLTIANVDVPGKYGDLILGLSLTSPRLCGGGRAF